MERTFKCFKICNFVAITLQIQGKTRRKLKKREGEGGRGVGEGEVRKSVKREGGGKKVSEFMY